MKYKGYTGHVEYDDEAKIFHGEVLGIKDVVTFQGTTVDEIEQAFKDSIDDYLAFCAQRGEEPDRPFSGKFNLRIPLIRKGPYTRIETKVEKEPVEKSIPWREVFSEGIEEFTEAGLVLKGARLKEDLTQKELAEKLDVKIHHISQMEHGKRSIGKEMARRLGAVLNINYRVFL